MSGKRALQSISREYYSNILLLDPDGSPLTTISEKRAKWYLNRGLANSLGAGDGYSDKVQLTFVPRNSSSNKFLRAILPTQCVVCGVKEGLTVHHVVPSAIKKFFPPELKNHTRQWCVLLCEEHHLEAEKLCRPIYESSLQQAMNAAQKKGIVRTKLYHKIVRMIEGEKQLIEKIKESADAKDLETLTPILDTIYAKSDEALKIKDFIKRSRLSQKSLSKDVMTEWATQFIEDNGGIEALKQKFKDEFLKLSPQFLNEGFLTDHEDTSNS